MSSTKKNLIYQTLYQVLVIILPFITSPYVARVLGNSTAGIHSYTNSVANYFVVFSMLGIEQYGNRYMARVRDNEEERNRVFSELITIHFVVSITISILYFLYIFLFESQYTTIFLIQGFFVISAVFDINWLFFGLEKFKLTVTRNVIIKVVSVICIFEFVHSPNDLWIYSSIMAGGTLINHLVLWRFISRYVKFRRVSIKKCLYHLKPLLVLFIAVVAAHVYRMIDKVMLGSVGYMADLGCYDYADKVIRIPLSLITAVGTVMLSKMSNLFAKNEQKKAKEILETSAFFVVVMSIAMAFGIASIAPEFMIIYLGKGYEKSVFLVELLAVTIPLIGWNNFVRTQLLIPLQKDIIYTKAVTVGALINFVLNLVLIRTLSAEGAAIATIAAYIIVLLIQTIPLIKSTQIRSYFKFIPVPLFSGIVMFCVVRIIGVKLGTSISTVICEIIVGGAIYLSIIFIYGLRIRNNIVLSVISSVRKALHINK